MIKNYRRRVEIARFIRVLESFIGVKYYWPKIEIGEDPTSKPMAGNDDPILGFDCSGLISEACRSVGWIGGYERLSSDGFLNDNRFEKTNDAINPGDILVYGRRLDDGTLDAYHVAACIDAYHIIEAGGGGRGTDTDKEAAALNAFVRVRPIEWRRSERIAVLRKA